MDVRAARAIISDVTQLIDGRFYGATQSSAPVGVGQIYANVRCPIYDDIDNVFDTVESLVYVLTHECDIDQTNNRPFNKHLIVCPIIPLENTVAALAAETSDEQIRSFLCELVNGNISRLVYISPFNPKLNSGGVLFLNQLSHTHINALSLPQVEHAATVSDFALQKIDRALENHLRRPKARPLPYQY